MRTDELALHSQIRATFASNVVTLSALRGAGVLFQRWLRATPPPLPGLRAGCRATPPDDTPLRIEVHAESMEFGYELVQLAPYAYAACLHGVLRLRSVCHGMAPFYTFAPPAPEVPCTRSVRIDHSANASWSMRMQHAQPVGRFWERQPPYRAWYRQPALRGRNGGRTLALVLAKQGILGMPSFAPSGVHNAWSLEGLLALLARLSARAGRVYYLRAGAALPAEQTGDDPRDAYNDTAEIRARLPRVRLLHDMVSPGPEYANELNALQLKLAATADVTVATQGGAAVLASLVATRLVLLCRVGQECFGRPPDVQWWRRLNGATIVTGGNETALTEHAVALLATATATATATA